MPELDFFQFQELLAAQKPVPPVVVIYGFHEFLGEILLRGLTDLFLKEKNEFNYRRYYCDDEEESRWDNILSEAGSSTFFISARKIVVVTMRSERKLSLSAVDRQALAEYVRQPSASTLLVLYVSLDLLKDDYKQVKKDRIDNFLKIFPRDQVLLINLDRVRDNDIKAYIKHYLQERKVNISSAAIEKMLEMKGENFVEILQQLPKIEMAALGTGSVDTGNIDEVITGIGSYSIWELSEAIEKEDVKAYLRILQYLFLNGIKPAFIIGTIISHYQRIFTAKFLLRCRIPVSDIGKILHQPAFLLDRFMHLVRDFPDGKIREIQKLIYRLDYESKTGSEETARIMLQTFVFDIRRLKRGG